jgi:GST-like protein
MAGQNQHFSRFAPEKLPYAIERYVKETNRLYGVLERRLAEHPFLGGSAYSIADMASYPWIVPWEMQGQDLADFPHLRRWFEGIRERPATVRAYARGEGLRTQAATSDEARRILFGQTAASVAPR